MYKIIIFGTGSGANKITDFFTSEELSNNIEILAYVDSIRKGMFKEKNILSITELSEYYYDYIVIGSDYFEEITIKLKENNIDINKVIPFFDDNYWINDTNELARFILEHKHNFLSFQNGHFYSTIPNMKEVFENQENIFNKNLEYIEGVDLNTKYQLQLLEEFSGYYKDMPFTNKKIDSLRYHFENNAFEYSDAIILYSILRHLKPNKLIEVGSGYSSCVTLDTNELFLENKIKCKFIEPYPNLLKGLVKDNDSIDIIEKKLQDVSIDVFEELEAGDILFIDSTHVSKCNSDVNYIIFNILPKLKSGVIIHFHDIFYPFEYPKTWIYSGKYWNEAYVLRAFLQYNNNFKIIFFNDYINSKFSEKVKANMPLCEKNTGASIWLEKQ
ncbi:class I SAM-dependent methyltransferase [Clostridium saccharoperbutylacetonicum]|uniref:class I SAM-dependent methyltransferase n=1 Tax=Clostridium saccharoperbutylacetonicum TaxID=36745 RepID=UPI000983CB7E|nr:class I SAM-dependent methyltransferase [Clostridium saccharoperbutylacetonicum]AQR96994.1 hypothetical protein CLSAP_43180 [Clostridium saccharoperbutylacetonicum]NSB32873.1 hypothetical protein [Clostridium saccharoperbutylacetonicum]